MRQSLKKTIDGTLYDRAVVRLVHNCMLRVRRWCLSIRRKARFCADVFQLFDS